MEILSYWRPLGKTHRDSVEIQSLVQIACKNAMHNWFDSREVFMTAPQLSSRTLPRITRGKVTHQIIAHKTRGSTCRKSMCALQTLDMQGFLAELVQTHSSNPLYPLREVFLEEATVSNRKSDFLGIVSLSGRLHQNTLWPSAPVSPLLPCITVGVNSTGYCFLEALSVPDFFIDVRLNKICLNRQNITC